MHFDPRQLQALATLVEEQHFERAASRLGISQSAISQRLKQLEQQLGEVLLVRSHPLTATAKGELLIAHYRQLELLQQQLTLQLKPQSDASFSRLAIAVNADSLATWFLPAINEFSKQHKLLLELKIDDQDTSHQLLQRGEVVGCITSEPKPQQGCHIASLGQMPYRCVAAPSFFQHYFAKGIDLQSLNSAPAVEFNHKDELHLRYLQQFMGYSDNLYPRHRIPSSESFQQAILTGLGYGILPANQCDREIASGALQELLPGVALPVDLYWQSWSIGNATIKALSHQLVDYAREVFEPFSSAG